MKLRAIGFCSVALLIMTADPLLADNGASGVSARQLNDHLEQYVGKQVVVRGQIDRVLGNGSYIIQDLNTPFAETDSAAHRILVFTAPATVTPDHTAQRAGIAAPRFKEGDNVQFRGQVQEFNDTGVLVIDPTSVQAGYLRSATP